MIVTTAFASLVIILRTVLIQIMTEFGLARNIYRVLVCLYENFGCCHTKYVQVTVVIVAPKYFIHH
ncbi:hypothetical protein BEN49_09705 [Hymenobacter coccineus]|uniref:Uncharacterized protein n=1 Tax=Hymenobacter coccineus TaxID=1908235 RepID=A0A1G1TE58_9BACT|nr:hypothetical protein BEN49_09705 [Hymenobacter coccineus]